MRGYVIRRLLLIIPTIFLVSFIVFFMLRIVPGSIIDLKTKERIEVTPEARHIMAKELGLDALVPVQYGRWMGFLRQEDGSFSGIFQGNLGNSLWRGTPVLDEILVRWPVTLELGFLGLIIAQLIALPVGVLSAVNLTW